LTRVAGCDPVEPTLARRQDVEVPTPSKNSRDPVLLALGAAIRRRRSKVKLSQEKLAGLADLDRSYLGQIERGENSVAIHPLIRIANALNTTLAELFTDAGL
jgi:DNA-binding XRE family transcriptional regulator